MREWKFNIMRRLVIILIIALAVAYSFYSEHKYQQSVEVSRSLYQKLVEKYKTAESYSDKGTITWPSGKKEYFVTRLKKPSEIFCVSQNNEISFSTTPTHLENGFQLWGKNGKIKRVTFNNNKLNPIGYYESISDALFMNDRFVLLNHIPWLFTGKKHTVTSILPPNFFPAEKAKYGNKECQVIVKGIFQQGTSIIKYFIDKETMKILKIECLDGNRGKKQVRSKGRSTRLLINTCPLLYAIEIQDVALNQPIKAQNFINQLKIDG